MARKNALFSITVLFLGLLALASLASMLQTTVSAQSSPVRTTTYNASPLNLDFEQSGELTGWLATTQSMGYPAKLSEENPKTGKRCALLYSDESGNTSRFGNIMQAIDATPYRGKQIHYRAAVKMEGVQGQLQAQAQLWMRVDKKGGGFSFFDNMDDRPITSNQWGYYEIVGEVDAQAETIYIGMILLGKGKAWLDDVTFEAKEPTILAAEPARLLTDAGLKNLIAFTRLLGYVRHFHPSDEAVATDWEAFAHAGVKSVEAAKTPAELAQKLNELFQPVAPTVRVYANGPAPAGSAQTGTAGTKIVFWKHNGFGHSGGSLRTPYRSERIYRNNTAPTADSPDPGKPYIADLGGNVTALVPIAVYADDKGTLPRAEKKEAIEKASTKEFVKYSGRDRAVRLAGVALAWNIFQHFYPYFDVVKTDWQQELAKALSAAASDADDLSYLTTLRRLVAALHDGHGGIYYPGDPNDSSLPLVWEWIENRLVITHITPESGSLVKPGEVVVKINGRASAECLAEKAALISSPTEQWRRYRALEELRAGAVNSEVQLEVQDTAGKARTVSLKRSVRLHSVTEAKPPKVHEIKPGIYYVDLDRIEDKDFIEALPKLEKAAGIIFDLRGYPRVSTLVLTHLITADAASARWNIPVVTLPDREKFTEFDTSGRWTLTPKSPRLKAKVAFITDGRAISYAETYMGIVEAYKLAEIVGEATAGTNGNVNPIKLPGNYQIFWTGMKVLKHDGSQHHGVGIKPTVPVSRTIRGVAEGRDEQLEKAIEIVSK